MVFSAVVLVVMFIAFLFSSFIKDALPAFDFSYIALIAGGVQLIKDIILQIQKKIQMLKIIKGLPWEIPLFLMSMFILVENAIYIELIQDAAKIVFRLVNN